MSTLELTREQQKTLLPLIARLDRAVHALAAERHELGLLAADADIPNEVYLKQTQRASEAREEYDSAYRALWSAAGGRF